MSGKHDPDSSRPSGFRLPGVSDMVDEKDKKPMPRWVPISLLALTTVALAVPMVLLRRQFAGAVSRSVKDAPPPRRTTSVTAPGPLQSKPAQRKAPTAASLTSPTASTTPLPLQAKPSSPVSSSEDGFSDAFYSVKAFGIATAIVTAGAVTTVWGVKLAMGVQDTREFAHRMRQLILTKMPVLSSRIHRPPSSEDNPEDWTPAVSLDASAPHGNSGEIEWSWPSAEERLRLAFQERGFSGWAEAVMHELEAEGRAERKKRGHS